MRKRYFTSYKKLPTKIILFTVCFVATAKDLEPEINMICFAATNQWVCAPEDQQNIASEKAQKLIQQNSSEYVASDVVIKSINIPKFNPTTSSINSGGAKSKPISAYIYPQATPTAIPKATVISNTDNPYAKLWSHQLIGLSTSQSAINFVRTKNLDKNEVLIIKSIRDDMDWWIVLYGLYKDKQAGLNNEVHLPDNIDKPWLRPLKNLKVTGSIERY